MQILTFKEVKKLQDYYSWAQFYHNSEQLAVSRYPRHYYYENNKKIKLIPESDKLAYDKVQQEILKIGNK